MTTTTAPNTADAGVVCLKALETLSTVAGGPTPLRMGLSVLLTATLVDVGVPVVAIGPPSVTDTPLIGTVEGGGGVLERRVVRKAQNVVTGPRGSGTRPRHTVVTVVTGMSRETSTRGTSTIALSVRTPVGVRLPSSVVSQGTTLRRLPIARDLVRGPSSLSLV